MEMMQDGGLGHSWLLFFLQAHQVYSYMQINPLWEEFRNQLKDNCTSSDWESSPIEAAGKCETNSATQTLPGHCASQLRGTSNSQLLPEEQRGYETHIQHSSLFECHQGHWLPHPPALKANGDFPGGPVAKTCAQCRGPGFNPWSGN